jgi:hypothetical protein
MGTCMAVIRSGVQCSQVTTTSISHTVPCRAKSTCQANDKEGYV